MSLRAGPTAAADGAGREPGGPVPAGANSLPKQRAALFRQAVPAALLVGVFCVATGLRFAGLNWDRGFLFQPDERQILMVVEGLHWPHGGEWSQVLGPRSPLNPRFFAYGSLPIYLLRLLQALLSVDISTLYLPARALTASYDLLTIAIVYAAGRKLAGRRVGLLAAAFLAVSVLPVQLSHFAVVDPLLTLLSTLTVYALLTVGERGSLSAGLAAGLCTGLALATKVSAFPLLVVGWVAWALWAVRCRPLPRPGRGLAGMALTGLAAALAFLAAEPYAFLDWFRFAVAVVREGAMARGTPVVPYTEQYVGTVPYLYPLRQLVVWSLGLPLGLLAMAGLAWQSWEGLRRRRTADLILLAWFWAYFLVVGSFHAKFSRYLAPLIPWLCLMASLLVVRLWERVQGRRRLRWGVAGLTSGILALTTLYAVAFVSIYLRPHPWALASDWLCQNMAAGSVLVVEDWDDWLPAKPGPACAGPFQRLPLDLYGPDNVGKLDRIVTALTQADYVVVASQRAYGSVGARPQDYPLTSAYYRLLFSGELGFRLADVEASYPRLGPLAIVDDPLAGSGLPQPVPVGYPDPAPLTLSLGRADESYSVYDHPRTLIFKKDAALPPETLRALLSFGL